jgi:hypothetical protein
MSDELRLGRSLPGDSEHMRGFMAGVRACAHFMPCFDAWAGSRAVDSIARGLLEGVEDPSQDPGEDLHTKSWLGIESAAEDNHLALEIAQDVMIDLDAILAPLIGAENADTASKAISDKLEGITRKAIDERIRLEPRTDMTRPNS